MAASPRFASILRDARKSALLRMRSEIYSQPRAPRRRQQKGPGRNRGL